VVSVALWPSRPSPPAQAHLWFEYLAQLGSRVMKMREFVPAAVAADLPSGPLASASFGVDKYHKPGLLRFPSASGANRDRKAVQARRGCRSISSPVSESLRQLPPALRDCADPRRSQWQAAPHLSTLGHTVRDLQPGAAVRNLPAAQRKADRTGAIRQNPVRHRSRHRDATRQTATPGQDREAKRLIATRFGSKPRNAVEMTGGGKRGKTQNRFPSLSTALGNRCRDSHIPTASTNWYISQNQNRKEHPDDRNARLGQRGHL